MNLEKKELLSDLTDHSGYPVLIEFIEELIRTQETELLRYDVHARGPDGLVYLRCEVQGARKLKVALETQLKKTRVAALEA